MSDLSPDVELRLHALDMARQHHVPTNLTDAPANADDVVETAKKFEAFLTGSEQGA